MGRGPSVVCRLQTTADQSCGCLQTREHAPASWGHGVIAALCPVIFLWSWLMWGRLLLSVTHSHVCTHTHTHRSDLPKRSGFPPSRRQHVVLPCLLSDSGGVVVHHVGEIIMELCFLGRDIREDPRWCWVYRRPVLLWEGFWWSLNCNEATVCMCQIYEHDKHNREWIHYQWIWATPSIITEHTYCNCNYTVDRHFTDTQGFLLFTETSLTQTMNLVLWIIRRITVEFGDENEIQVWFFFCMGLNITPEPGFLFIKIIYFLTQKKTSCFLYFLWFEPDDLHRPSMSASLLLDSQSGHTKFST